MSLHPQKKHSDNEENFWISATDMMAGILTVVLLLLMLFILFLNMSTDEVFSFNDATEVGHYSATPDEYHHIEYDDNDDDHDHDHDDEDHSSGGGGGEGHTEPTQETTVSGGNGSENDPDKSAVFVTVVDADTGSTIKKAGTEFELYADKNGIGGLQTLHTYYPEKIEYKQYATTAQGTFYLPEKITRGWYSLHNIVPPKGYYIDENVDFEIDDYWDWPEPYMVEVEMKPIKRAVRVQVNDGDSTEPVENVVYQVTAAENVVTVDGTIRYKKGEEVDEITTNEKGYAESKELYIGEYSLKQTSAPGYYAINSQTVSASVAEEPEDDTGIISIDCYKTKFTVSLTDERTEEPIAGAVYTMEGRDDLVTDENGEFTVSDLEKEVKYTLDASSLPDGYLKNDTMIEFTVDNDGLINESASYVYNDTAYTISLSVGIKDLVFEHPATGLDLCLTDEEGNVIDEWTSDKNDHIITGLEQGVYHIRKSSEEEDLASIDLKDTAELQDITIKMWDTIDLYAILIGIGIILLAVVVTGVLIRRKKAGKKREQ